LHADVENGLSYTVAHQAEEQARRANEMAVAAHRLNVLAAIFFPIGTVAAIFGMNLVHGYEHRQSPWMFWGVSAVSLVVGLFLAQYIVRRPPPPPPPRGPGAGRPVRGGPSGKKKR
jgi:Mg2+ and Co2+ transporter CorA